MDKPLADLLNAVTSLTSPDGNAEVAHARPDLRREERKGVPEVILAGSKSPEQVVRIAEAFLAARGRAIVSRVGPELDAHLRQHFARRAEPAERRGHAGDAEHDAGAAAPADAGSAAPADAGSAAPAVVESYPLSQMVVVRRPGQVVPKTGGRVGIVTAGTSDIGVAEQAAVIAREMGCEVQLVSDVGVAGIHRLLQPLQRMLEAEVDVVVVAAGMDGALPSVVSGLVDVPVIGLPVSTGYGLGGGGVAALLSMLQTCSPGLTVVNIDNGVGAGATAGIVANRVARARRSQGA